MDYEYVITSAYDSQEPHWTQRYEKEFGAWENFSYSKIGVLLKNIEQLIFTRQKESATLSYSIQMEGW
jgi:hypothetical protein